MGLHPSEIVQGYELARDKALESLAELEVGKIELPPTQQSLKNSITTSLASKQFGHEDFLADLVSQAAMTVMPKDPSQFNVDNVRVVKIMGGHLFESRVLRGMVFGRQPEGKFNSNYKFLFMLSFLYLQVLQETLQKLKLQFSVAVLTFHKLKRKEPYY